MDLDASDDIEHAHRVLRQALVDSDVQVADQKTFAYCALALDLLWPGHPTYQSTIRWALEHPQQFGMYEWLYHRAFDSESKERLFKALYGSARRPQDVVRSRLLAKKSWQQIVDDLARIAQDIDVDGWVKAADDARRADVREVFAYCVERVIPNYPFCGFVLASQPLGDARLIRMAQLALLSKDPRLGHRSPPMTKSYPSATALVAELAHCIEFLWPNIKCNLAYDLDPIKRFYVELIEDAQLLGECKPHENPASYNLARLIREHTFLTDEQATVLVGTYNHAEDCLPTTHPLRARLAGLRLKNLGRDSDAGYRTLDLHLILSDTALPQELRREAAAQIVYGQPSDWWHDEDLQLVCQLFAGTELDEHAAVRLHPIRRYARHPADRFADVAKLIARRRNTEAFRRFLDDVRTRPLTPDEARGLWSAGSDLLVPEFNRIALSTLRSQAGEAASA